MYHSLSHHAMATNLNLVEPSQASGCSLAVDNVSKEDLLNLMMKNMIQMANTVKEVGTKDLQQQEKITSRRRFRSGSLSISHEENYPDILNKKGLFVEKLTDALDLATHEIPLPKNRVYCSYLMKELFKDRYNEMKENIHVKMEEIKRQMHDNSRLISQYGIISKLEENETIENELQAEHKNNVATLNEVKEDLKTVMTTLFNPEDTEIAQSAIKLMMDAAIKNLDCLEKHYVEIPVSALSTPPILCLLDACVIMQHPDNHQLYRLCVEE